MSSEREVSLNSGRNVYDNLDTELYEGKPLFMDDHLKFHGLVAIGDARTYSYAQNLSALIQIPIVGIPASLCCNVAGTDRVIGMDSALNDLLRGIDRAADAANVQKKIIVVHIKGEYCACLVKLAGLAGGAELLIVDESYGQEAFKQQVQEKIRQLQRILGLGKSFATILFFSEHSAEADDRLRYVAHRLKEAGITPEPAMISLETSLGGIIPTAFDRILAQRLGEQALITLQQKMEMRDHSFHMVGITGREISAVAASSLKNGFRSSCSAPLSAELAECIDLMALPGSSCTGMGGVIAWTDTGDAGDWQGIWTCKQCGNSRQVYFNPKQMLCVYCMKESCRNYGYIRISRRL